MGVSRTEATAQRLRRGGLSGRSRLRPGAMSGGARGRPTANWPTPGFCVARSLQAI